MSDFVSAPAAGIPVAGVPPAAAFTPWRRRRTPTQPLARPDARPCGPLRLMIAAANIFLLAQQDERP